MRVPAPRPRASRRPSPAQRLAAIIGHGAQGAALARTLAGEGLRTRADLRRPDVLARLPREARANVLFNPDRNVPLARAQAVMAEVRRRAVFEFAGADGRPRAAPRGHPPELVPVGSVRREAPRVADLDFLVVVPDDYGPLFFETLDAFALRPPRAGDRLEIADTYAAGERRRSLILRERPRGGGPAATAPTSSSPPPRRSHSRYSTIPARASTTSGRGRSRSEKAGGSTSTGCSTRRPAAASAGRRRSGRSATSPSSWT